MKRVLSGIQPSGQLHLGNYFGMMARMIRYQEENDLFCFIVNYHALTTIHDKEVLKSNTFNDRFTIKTFYHGSICHIQPNSV